MYGRGAPRLRSPHLHARAGAPGPEAALDQGERLPRRAVARGALQAGERGAVARRGRASSAAPAGGGAGALPAHEQGALDVSQAALSAPARSEALEPAAAAGL